MEKKILITGVAGFIGFSFAKELVKKNFIIIGLDNINNYYSKKLKRDQNKLLKKNKNFKFFKLNLKNKKKLEKLFKKYRF